MDPQASGSFIPKQPLVEARRGGGGGGLFVMLAALLLVFSVIAAGGVFGYKTLLERSLVTKDSSLKSAEGAFQPSIIEDLVRLNGRINQTEGLLQKHVAPSAVFDFLSTITLQAVQFTSFSFELETGGAANITLAGVGDSFSTVALQSDQFGETRALKNVVFSDVTIAQSGRVTFNVKATLDPTLYLYTRVPDSTTMPPAATLPASGAATSTSSVSGQTTP